MGSKKRIIILAGALVISFALSAGAFLMLVPAPKPAAAEGEPEAGQSPYDRLAYGPAPLGTEPLKPTERQLEELTRDLRRRLAECREREDKLAKEEKRMQMALETIQKEAQDLEKLQFQLVGPLAKLRTAKAELEKTIITIRRTEQANTKRTATVYEKMDPARAAVILAEMCKSKQEDYAAKLLHYMTEKKAAGVLGEIKDEALAAQLTAMLKRIKEEKG